MAWKKRAVLVVSKEKRNEKIWNLHSIVTDLNLGQDVANKKERK